MCVYVCVYVCVCVASYPPIVMSGGGGNKPANDMPQPPISPSEREAREDADNVDPIQLVRPRLSLSLFLSLSLSLSLCVFEVKWCVQKKN